MGMFLLGLFLGGTIGFCTCALFSMNKLSDAEKVVSTRSHQNNCSKES